MYDAATLTNKLTPGVSLSSTNSCRINNNNNNHETIPQRDVAARPPSPALPPSLPSSSRPRFCCASVPLHALCHSPFCYLRYPFTSMRSDRSEPTPQLRRYWRRRNTCGGRTGWCPSRKRGAGVGRESLTGAARLTSPTGTLVTITEFGVDEEGWPNVLLSI